MEESVAVVLAGAIGVVGAGGAAALTGWSQRRQASAAAAETRAFWRTQTRRETYGRFLTAAAEAREELSGIWHQLKDVKSRAAIDDAERRLTTARPLVYAVQRAGADVAMEGPLGLRHPCQETEEDIELFFASLRTLISHLLDDDAEASPRDRRLCAEQRMNVRMSIATFAQAANVVLDRLDEDPGDQKLDAPLVGDQQDMLWLIDQVILVTGVARHEVKTHLSLMALGFDSFSIMELTARAEERYRVPYQVIWRWNNMSLSEVAARLTVARAVATEKLPT